MPVVPEPKVGDVIVACKTDTGDRDLARIVRISDQLRLITAECFGAKRSFRAWSEAVGCALTSSASFKLRLPAAGELREIQAEKDHAALAASVGRTIASSRTRDRDLRSLGREELRALARRLGLTVPSEAVLAPAAVYAHTNTSEQFPVTNAELLLWGERAMRANGWEPPQAGSYPYIVHREEDGAANEVALEVEQLGLAQAAYLRKDHTVVPLVSAAPWLGWLIHRMRITTGDPTASVRFDEKERLWVADAALRYDGGFQRLRSVGFTDFAAIIPVLDR